MCCGFWCLLLLYTYCSIFCNISCGCLHVSHYNKCIAVYFTVYSAVPVVEFVDVLNVSEHNVVFVGETRRDVLWAARHLPHVRLHHDTVLLSEGTVQYDAVQLTLKTWYHICEFERVEKWFYGVVHSVPRCTPADPWRRLSLSEGAPPWCTWENTNTGWQVLCSTLTVFLKC